ncbi:mitochondrial coenzyme A transporter SLC25A42 [Hermetia illucens]|uniref:mitochondrial coenzyme A transporter SLC25A42 n=1 Tax=Hermetia illucens TaxID=343691 RepID=UPI0018CC505A|nr:mitochondrial coenzyme A transporter SLC25A42 [Hermetia illucens]
MEMSRLKNPNITMSITATSSTPNSSPVIQSSPPQHNVNESDPKISYGSSAQKLDNVDVVLTSMAAGAFAGALAKTTIAPLDRTKINFQINKDATYSFRGAISFIEKTYRNEGFFALWRGNSATMARIIPYSAIQFTAHEQWRKILKVDQHNTDTKGRRYIAGSLAGVTSQSLTYPLDLARARMAVTNKYSGYTSLRQVFVKIWVEEGPLTLYRGYFATVLGVIPYAGTSFFTYETLKKEYYELTGSKTPHTLVSLAFGALAGLAGQTSSYPLDIVRRRMQTMGIKHKNQQYSTLISTLSKIYREEGIKNGFFKGLSMNWIKGPIAVGISFTTYDLTKEFLRELALYKKGRFG